MAGSFLGAVFEGVEDDVGQVGVDDRIGDLAAPSLGPQHLGGAQHPQVLRDERLGGARVFDQLVHAAGAVAQVGEDLEAQGVREGLQQLGGGGVGELGHSHIVALQYVNGNGPTGGIGHPLENWCTPYQPDPSWKKPTPTSVQPALVMLR